MALWTIMMRIRKSMTKNLFSFHIHFRLDSKVEKLDVSDFTRSILKDVLQAANTGLFRQDCSSVYSRCSVASPSTRKPWMWSVRFFYYVIFFQFIPHAAGSEELLKQSFSDQTFKSENSYNKCVMNLYRAKQAANV